MMRVRTLLVVFGFVCTACAGILVFVMTCESFSPPPAAAPVLQLRGVPLTLELATTPAARAEGLSGRESVPDNYGMLFVFPYPEKVGFWMKGMLVPLDIFWLNSKGQVLFLAASVATSTYPSVLYPTTAAQYVLETRAGFGQAHDVATGTAFELKNIPSVSK